MKLLFIQTFLSSRKMYWGCKEVKPPTICAFFPQSLVAILMIGLIAFKFCSVTHNGKHKTVEACSLHKKTLSLIIQSRYWTRGWNTSPLIEGIVEFMAPTQTIAMDCYNNRWQEPMAFNGCLLLTGRRKSKLRSCTQRGFINHLQKHHCF